MRITEKLITKAVLDLLQERPYSKITVTDIVARCEINRNTFYYHYADIPDLIQHLLQQGMRELYRVDRDFKRPLTFVLYIVLVADQYKSILRNLYHSEMQACLEKEITILCTRFSVRRVHRMMKQSALRREDAKLLVRYWSSVVKGLFFDWLKHDMDYDLSKIVRRVCLLTSSRRNWTAL